MKTTCMLLLALFVLCSCASMETWSESEKRAAMIVAGIAVGALVVSNMDDDTFIENNCAKVLPHGICE